jgi:hypothetical protein
MPATMHKLAHTTSVSQPHHIQSWLPEANKGPFLKGHMQAGAVSVHGLVNEVSRVSGTACCNSLAISTYHVQFCADRP